MDSFRLEGKRIADIKLIGFCYSMSDHILESNIVIETDEYDEFYEYIETGLEIDYDAPITMFAEIDEPVLIRFADGDVLEVLEECDGEHRVSMNSIPWNIQAGINRPNIDASKFFKDCIGRTITSVEIHTGKNCDKDNIWKSMNTAEYKGKEYVTEIILRFDDGNGLMFYGWIDFCHIVYVDHNNVSITKPFREVASSLFNLEELVADLTSVED